MPWNEKYPLFLTLDLVEDMIWGVKLGCRPGRGYNLGDQIRVSTSRKGNLGGQIGSATSRKDNLGGQIGPATSWKANLGGQIGPATSREG